MSDIDTKLIMKELLDQNKALGRIEATQSAMDKKLDKAISDNEKVEVRVTTLEAAHNKQLGSVRVWSALISAAVSGVVGYVSGRNH